MDNIYTPNPLRPPSYDKYRKVYIYGVPLLAILFIVLKLSGNTIEVNGLISDSLATTKPDTETVFEPSSLSGIRCENSTDRPLAVMYSSDSETRPLSGIGQADMVFEMPVVDVGVTRMMAIFHCAEPGEIGSIRSSRLDFIPLVQGMNAIYAHFGGEKDALDLLNKGVVDNVNGLKYDDGITYYRKKSVPRPHNSFTSYDRLIAKAHDLNYKIQGGTNYYPHEENPESDGTLNPPPVFNDEWRVVWKYDVERNAYKRSRNSKSEIDENTSEQVFAQNVVFDGNDFDQN